MNMAKLSWIAYQTPSKVKEMWAAEKKDLAGTNWSPFSAMAADEPQYADCPACDAQAYACKMGACPRAPLVLACRGTSSIQDAMVDGSLQLVPFTFADGKPKQGVAVHRGFYRQFKGILPQIDPLYKGHLAAGGTLICTGHSLGAAVATLAALYYGERYPGQVSYIGFGSPRVGNGTFARFFATKVTDYTRVVNGRDPVPKVPPPGEYTHVGAETHVGRRDPYPAIAALTDLPDHDIANYIHNLETSVPLQVTSVPLQHSNWLTEVLSKFRA